MSSFRSPEVSECTVCGARTNLVLTDHVPSARGPSGRMIWGDHREWTTCPHAESCWHHELEARIQWLRFPHPESVRKTLIREINRIRKDPRHIIRNDIEDIDSAAAPTRRVRITFARSPDAAFIRCTHHHDRDGQIIEATEVPVEPPLR